MNGYQEEEKKTENECGMDSIDLKGHINLCCCYVIEEDGSYKDPCYIPAKE